MRPYESRLLQESALDETCNTSDAFAENAALCELAATVSNLGAQISAISSSDRGLNVFFLLFACGFAMLCAGSVRQKNVKNIMLKNLLDACGGTIGFWTIGYGLAFGDSTSSGKSFIGSWRNFCLAETTSAPASDGGLGFIDFFFHWAFAATATTIVAGTVAERCKMVAYLCYSFTVTALVFPVVVHWIWSSYGYLSAYAEDPFLGTGVIDFAGSGVVHITGGTTALIAAVILGPRMGRFYDEEGNIFPEAKQFAANSTALQCLGTFILWFGWYGFNPGSTLHVVGRDYTTALAAVTSTLGAASGAISCMLAQSFLDYYENGGEVTYDLTCAMNGLLIGLVSNTAGCAVITPWAAVIIGTIAGPIYIAASGALLRFRIDDVVDAVPVHLGGGLWGIIAVGFFAAPVQVGAAYGSTEYGVFYGGGKLLAAQICGLLFIIGWTTVVMLPFFTILRRLGMLRVDPLEEEVGLDVAHHKGAAYNYNHDSAHSLEELFEKNLSHSIPRRLPRSKKGKSSPALPPAVQPPNALDAMEEGHDDHSK